MTERAGVRMTLQIESIIEEKKNRLAPIVLKKAVKRGQFTLASGLKSDYYVNGKMVTLDSEGLYLIAEIMLDKLEGIECDAVGGLTLGADSIVGAMTALSFKRDRALSGFIVRRKPKTHGTKTLIEGDLRKGMKVAIVDDVSTTGVSSAKAIDAAKSIGCEIVKVLMVVDRRQGAAERFKKMKLTFDPIFTKEDLGL